MTHLTCPSMACCDVHRSWRSCSGRRHGVTAPGPTLPQPCKQSTIPLQPRTPNTALDAATIEPPPNMLAARRPTLASKQHNIPKNPIYLSLSLFNFLSNYIRSSNASMFAAPPVQAKHILNKTHLSPRSSFPFSSYTASSASL